MNKSEMKQFIDGLIFLENDELLDIWQSEDYENYSPEVFASIQSILSSRSVAVPNQSKKWQEEAPHLLPEGDISRSVILSRIAFFAGKGAFFGGGVSFLFFMTSLVTGRYNGPIMKFMLIDSNLPRILAILAYTFTWVLIGALVVFLFGLVVNLPRIIRAQK